MNSVAVDREVNHRTRRVGGSKSSMIPMVAGAPQGPESYLLIPFNVELLATSLTGQHSGVSADRLT